MFATILGRVADPFSPDPEPTLPQVDVEIDPLLSLLSNERRRLVIQIVADLGDDTIQRRELGKRIAAIQNGIEESDVGGQEYKRVNIALYQHHLEPLLEAGCIEGDRDEMWANERTRQIAQLADALDWATGGEV